MKTKSLLQFASLFVVSQAMARDCGLEIACYRRAVKDTAPDPIAELYADLVTAVNRGDLPGAQQLAAKIAA